MMDAEDDNNSRSRYDMLSERITKLYRINQIPTGQGNQKSLNLMNEKFIRILTPMSEKISFQVSLFSYLLFFFLSNYNS